MFFCGLISPLAIYLYFSEASLQAFTLASRSAGTATSHDALMLAEQFLRASRATKIAG